MKRYTIIAILLLSAGILSAQEKMISVFPANRQHPEGLLEGAGMRVPDEETILANIKKSRVPAATTAEGEAVTPTFRSAVKKASWRKATEDAHAGYYNPEGTLFLGYTYNPSSTGYEDIYVNDYPGIIGAWSYDLPCWKWTNNATGAYSSIDYSNGELSEYPTMIEDHDTYSIDENYNFYDSIVARGSYTSYMDITGDKGYLFQMATPVQIVHRESGDEYFALLNKYSAKDTLTGEDAKLASGGLYSGYTKDGLWPLTNAICVNQDGASTVLTYRVSSAIHYYFGTTEENGRVPKKFVTHYDKPQRLLYVKNITLAIGANGRMNLDSLVVDVYTESGKLIAHSSASSADLQEVKIMTNKDRMLTFNFQKKSDYGEMIQDGFSVDEPFRVEVSGFDASKNNFGIYAAKSSLYESKTEIIMENDSVMTYSYDPYIMLNGIYPTLHDWRKVQYPDYETGQVGDTIPVKFNLTDGLTYKYGATYAVSTGDGIAEFVFMSTFKPYDATTRYWTMDIERPDYVTMSADYEIHMNDDEEEPTIWEYYRAFTLYIYASEKPVIGDCIKIGKYGKSIVFRIDEVAESEEETTLARKLWKNGHIEIERAGKRYNAQGLLIE